VELLHNIGVGFGVALEPMKLLFALLGAVMGTLVGVLPGLGPTATIAMLIPITAGMDPLLAIILMAGVYYGSMYGGSTTSILINTPGEAASVMTCLDGFQLTQKGRAGAALGISAIGSFVAGTFSVLGLMLLAPVVSDVALSFGPVENFALMFLGFTVVISLAGKSILKGLLSCCVGLVLGAMGLDPVNGVPRLTYGTETLLKGIEFIAVVVGMFAIPEVLEGVEQSVGSLVRGKLHGLFPTREDLRKSWGAIGRGTLLGFCVGLVPGGSGTVATFLSYDLEKKVSRHPEEFGKGAIAGVAGPESANNAVTGASMIPLLTLGIPCGAPLAVLMGALMIHGMRPGPLLFSTSPDFVWGLIASMYIGNFMCLVLNLPLVGLWARLTLIPFPLLGPVVLVLCFVGTYGVNNSMFDVWVMGVSGVIAYFMKKIGVPLVPMVLALVVGPNLEATLRQSLAISKGSPLIFFTHPISLAILCLAAFSVFLSLRTRLKDAAGEDAA
jgi:putative tricarboxylic transport membrane protein